MFAKVPADKRAELLTRVYGTAPKAPVDDAVKTQNELPIEPATLGQAGLRDGILRERSLRLAG